jgi:single-strand DNA-binding protein
MVGGATDGKERNMTEQVGQARGGGRGLNQITLVGRMARDPDLRVTGEGVPRAWFVVAVPRPFASKDGDREADFIPVVAWRQLASAIAEHLTKGRLVGIAGRLQVTNLKSPDGSMRTSTEVVADEVVFLDAPRKPKGQLTGEP